MRLKSRIFSVRLGVVFALILTLSLVSIVRLLVIGSKSELKITAEQKNTYSVNIGKLRGTIFDTNMRAITNRETEIIGVVTPTESAIIKLNELLEKNSYEAALSTLKNGKPAIVALPNVVECDGIKCIEIKKHATENTAAEHLIGYLDYNGNGVSGLEAAFNDVLYTDEYINVSFSVTAQGKLLYDDANVNFNNSVYKHGVVTTLDLDMQQIAESAMEDIKKGAVIVVEAGTGKIRAMVSKPKYDITNVYKYLDDLDAPLINRALSVFDVGSVFKPCIAAAALDKSSDLASDYNCTGSETIAEHTFICNKHSGHGLLNIGDAIAYSCNTYFYNLAVKTGAKTLYNSASNYPFGQSIKLANGLVSDKGNLTALSRLYSSDAAIANFAIGQGDLLISPISLITLYDAIASNGVYHMPYLVEKTITFDGITTYENTTATKVMSEKTANMLKEYLKGVVTFGTGTKAKPTLCTAAGKTATAETGVIINGKQVSNGWFCGFFPADNPKYVAVVLCEDATSGGESAAPVFRKIADLAVNSGLIK